MTKAVFFVVVTSLVAGCANLPSNTPAVMTQVATDASAALAAYQAALGAAEQAEAGNPATEITIQAVAAKAAPYVANAQTVAAQATTAVTLAQLTAELLLDAAPHVTVVPNGQ